MSIVHQGLIEEGVYEQLSYAPPIADMIPERYTLIWCDVRALVHEDAGRAWANGFSVGTLFPAKSAIGMLEYKAGIFWRDKPEPSWGLNRKSEWEIVPATNNLVAALAPAAENGAWAVIRHPRRHRLDMAAHYVPTLQHLGLAHYLRFLRMKDRLAQLRVR